MAAEYSHEATRFLRTFALVIIGYENRTIKRSINLPFSAQLGPSTSKKMLRGNFMCVRF